MTKYVVEYRANGSVEVEADTSEEATDKALTRLFNLEALDESLDVNRVEQVRTYEAR